MKTIAELLKEWRKRKGLTQLQVMNHLGFSSMDRISRWETGKAEPGAKNLMKLILLYQIPIEQLQEYLADH
jgi:transcriptional regulator with XRE-family HTH domain